jgi:hypothetical protein
MHSVRNEITLAWFEPASIAQPSSLLRCLGSRRLIVEGGQRPFGPISLAPDLFH